MNKEGMASGSFTLGKAFFREWIVVGMLIFGGCCSNVYTLELLVTHAPKSGHLITFVQFFVVAVEGLASHIEWKKDSILPLGLKKRTVPLEYWLGMVALFWTVSVLNNYALGFRISMPLHIIFRSMGLFVSMAISWGFFGKSFSRAQVFGVVLVSVGVVAATYSSSAPTDDRNASDATSPFIEWLLGLSILFVALVLSCFLGQFQQVTYTKFGPAWQEALFYTHFLGMPAFLLFYGDLKHQFHEYNNSHLISFQDALAPIRSYLPQNMWQMTSLSPWNGVKIPVMWLNLALNVMTQYVCISGVHRLSSVASAVTLNLILSVRKFVSLVVSIVLFDSEFTAGHWFGTAAVFLGTAIYTKSSNSSSKPKKA